MYVGVQWGSVVLRFLFWPFLGSSGAGSLVGCVGGGGGRFL